MTRDQREIHRKKRIPLGIVDAAEVERIGAVLGRFRDRDQTAQPEASTESSK